MNKNDGYGNLSLFISELLKYLRGKESCACSKRKSVLVDTIFRKYEGSLWNCYQVFVWFPWLLMQTMNVRVVLENLRHGLDNFALYFQAVSLIELTFLLNLGKLLYLSMSSYGIESYVSLLHISFHLFLYTTFNHLQPPPQPYSSLLGCFSNFFPSHFSWSASFFLFLLYGTSS